MPRPAAGEKQALQKESEPLPAASAASGSGGTLAAKDTGALGRIRIHMASFVFLSASTPAKIISPTPGRFPALPCTE